MAKITDEKVLMDRVVNMLPKGIPASAIESVECDVYDEEGISYRVYLANGYWSPRVGCHTIRELTLADLRSVVRDIKVWPDDPALKDPAKGYGDTEATEAVRAMLREKRNRVEYKELEAMGATAAQLAIYSELDPLIITEENGLYYVTGIVEGYDLTAEEVLELLSELAGEEPTTIKALCKAYGMGQTALSRRFGIPLRTVQDWYSGRSNPPSYVVGMISDLLEHDWNEKGAKT